MGMKSVLSLRGKSINPGCLETQLFIQRFKIAGAYSLKDVLTLWRLKQIYINNNAVGTSHRPLSASTSKATELMLHVVRTADGQSYETQTYTAWVDAQCSVEKLLV